jgi:hypothetical protein
MNLKISMNLVTIYCAHDSTIAQSVITFYISLYIYIFKMKMFL